MGITGLLPFLDKASRKAHISEFRGCTVGIDSYCWLHKAAIGCAEKLIRGENTNDYVLYCMRYIKLLQSFDVRPILVFDGQHLPAKSLTEKKRREQRHYAKKKTAELLRLGKSDEARKYMTRSIDVTHKMALTLIKECRKNGIDCIVAPYEADAQLAYLDAQKMVHFVITEDSDLVLFGCRKIFFKLDAEGFGTLVDSDKIHVCMKLRPDIYTFDKFRYMCILSGCDYLESLPGIGLKKALKFISMTADPSIYNVLAKLPSYLKLTNLVVTNEYREAFMVAEATFKHQLVFNPVQRKLQPLTDLELCGTNVEYCRNSGEMIDNDLGYQLALGNVDPFTHERVDNWSPDSSNSILHHASIWAPTYQKPRKKSLKLHAPDTQALGTIVSLTIQEEINYDEKWQEELERYNVTEQPVKKQKVKERSLSPVLSKPVNLVPFKKLSKFQRTEINTQKTLTSRFFSFKTKSDSSDVDFDIHLGSVDQCTKETESSVSMVDSANKITEDKENTNKRTFSSETEKSDSDEHESVVCEPDIHCNITPNSDSSNATSLSDCSQFDLEKQIIELPEITYADDAVVETCPTTSNQSENNMNLKNTTEDIIYIGHVDPDCGRERQEQPKPKTVLTPIRRLGLPPIRKKVPDKNQPTLFDMFPALKRTK